MSCSPYPICSVDEGNSAVVVSGVRYDLLLLQPSPTHLSP